MSQNIRKKIILVNASAAKTGGAETIIRTFVHEISNDGNHNYVILSPLTFKEKSANVTHVFKSTNGINSILFSAFSIFIFILKYRPDKVLSFNNINYIFSLKKGITYFHQPKALSGSKESKVKAYKLLINLFLRQNLFVVQSTEVKRMFEKTFPIKPSNVIACWPGFNIPEKESLPPETDIFFETHKPNKIGILPIAYDGTHKNLALLNELAPFFKNNNIKIITLLEEEFSLFGEKEVFLNIGAVSRSTLFSLYAKADFLIFTSKEETVGLPIFEFLQQGKPAFVYNASYASAFYNQFDEPENLILFNTADELESVFPQKINVRFNGIDYSQGEWQKIINRL